MNWPREGVGDLYGRCAKAIFWAKLTLRPWLARLNLHLLFEGTALLNTIGLFDTRLNCLNNVFLTCVQWRRYSIYLRSFCLFSIGLHFFRFVYFLTFALSFTVYSCSKFALQVLVHFYFKSLSLFWESRVAVMRCKRWRCVRFTCFWYVYSSALFPMSLTTFSRLCLLEKNIVVMLCYYSL